MPPVLPPGPPASSSAWAPLSLPVFRMLWGTWVVANCCMWMNDVAAAWLMTSLTSSPVLVALVQSASTLPVFLLGLPSGAMADILDRRRYFMMTQVWVAAVAVLTCATVALDAMNAPLLLVLTFANGIGLAMRWPVFAAIVPELVPRSQLPAALALNGIAMNASRIIGPLVAGALIASVGSAYVFVLNATLSILAGFTIMRWRRIHQESPLGREPLGSAMRVGVQYVWQSGRMRAVLARIALFFLHSTALLALLPLVARGLPGGKAGTFTVLLASMGVGAIIAALLMPRIRNWLPLQPRVLVATGFAKWGMTGGTAAGLALADHVAGRDNPWAPTFAADRAPKLNSVPSLASFNGQVAKYLATGWAKPDLPSSKPLAEGEGRVETTPRGKVGRCRVGGVEHEVGAVCPHLGGILAWNDAAASWDCPLHGSRFAPDGTLRTQIEGDVAHHYPDTDTLEIENPRIRSVAANGRVTRASARQALANGDGSEVQLIGEAEIIREGVDGAPPINFRSEFLQAFLDTERVRSHLPVTVVQGGTEMRADSMEYSHLDREIRFGGRLRAVFSPRGTR